MSVAVTGWALRTPLGDDAATVVSALLAGAHGVRPNSVFPADSYPCRLGASIAAAPKPTPEARVLRRMGLWGLETAKQALASAVVQSGPRLGLFCAMGGLRAHWNDIMPALANQRDDRTDTWARGFRALHPFWMLQHLSNNAHALLAEAAQAHGEGLTFTGANAGAQALSGARRALLDGAVDVAVVMAYDSLLEPETVIDMAARGALSASDVDAWRGPYDQRAAGAVPGEAAATVILERRADAGDRALATLDAADAADGERHGTTATALTMAVERLAQRGALPQVDLIDGAALASAARDPEERAALAAFCGDDVPLGACQAALGQLGAATSVVQTIVLAELLQRRAAAPIAGLRQPATGPLRPIAAASACAGRTALGVSLGAPGLAGAVAIHAKEAPWLP